MNKPLYLNKCFELIILVHFQAPNHNFCSLWSLPFEACYGFLVFPAFKDYKMANGLVDMQMLW